MSGDISRVNLTFTVEKMFPMRRIEGDDGNALPDGNSTPLRGDISKILRPRLLEKHFDLDTVPVYVVENETITSRRIFLRWSKYHGILNCGQQCATDRFIPRRRGQDMEVARHCLLAEAPRNTEDEDNVNLIWQKKNMTRAMNTILPFGTKRRVLKLSQGIESSGGKIIGSLGGRPRNFYDDETDNDYKWPVKPRRRPMIGDIETILDIPHFQPCTHKNILDWGSRNLIAAAIDSRVCLVDASADYTANPKKFSFYDYCTVVKYNNSGESLLIGRIGGAIGIYDLSSGSETCQLKCSRTNDHYGLCSPQVVAWTKDDRIVLVGCSGGDITAYTVNTGKIIKHVEAHTSEVVALEFSPYYRFFASAGRDFVVDVFLWPEYERYVRLGHRGPVRALAWHPWESGLLCTGGGWGDGAVSFWNVPRHSCVGNRLQRKNASVDTLSWNKVTGELVVNWYIREGDNYSVKMPVYASVAQKTDAIVSSTKTHQRTFYALWSPDGSHLACQSGESIFIYAFFNETLKKRHLDDKKQGKKRRSNDIARTFSSYNLR